VSAAAVLALSFALPACIGEAPPADLTVPAPEPTPTFTRTQSSELYASLRAPLPGDIPVAQSCLARIAQANLLERNERDPAIRSVARAASVACRVRLVEEAVSRGVPTPGIPTGALGAADPEALACNDARSHLDLLARYDEAEAARHRPAVDGLCGRVAEAEAARAHRLAHPPAGAGDRRTPTCHRPKASLCEVVPSDGADRCARQDGLLSEAPCPVEDQVGLCALPDGITRSTYRAGGSPFDNLSARLDCERAGGAFTLTPPALP
jgi:hypothetical protein